MVCPPPAACRARGDGGRASVSTSAYRRAARPVPAWMTDSARTASRTAASVTIGAAGQRQGGAVARGSRAPGAADQVALGQVGVDRARLEGERAAVVGGHHAVVGEDAGGQHHAAERPSAIMDAPALLTPLPEPRLITSALAPVAMMAPLLVDELHAAGAELAGAADRVALVDQLKVALLPNTWLLGLSVISELAGAGQRDRRPAEADVGVAAAAGRVLP